MDVPDQIKSGETIPQLKVSVVIPTLNQARYLSDAITSVLGQDHVDTELIIIDGGSEDDSVEIIRTFENHIHYWVSEKDSGQSAAINKGFKEATGDIFCWLNSDDFLLPGSLAKAANALAFSELGLLIGNCIHLDEITGAIYGSDIVKAAQNYRLTLHDYIIQPSSFWTSRLWAATGQLSESLHYTLDWEWYLRALKTGAELITVPEFLSVYRIHPQHKTGSGGSERQREIEEVIKKWNTDAEFRAVASYYANRERIQRMSKKIHKLRLHQFRTQILKKLYPSIFNNISLEDAEASFRMVY